MTPEHPAAKGVEPVHPVPLSELLHAFDVYRPARKAFLDALGLPRSNRDPLAEFSEHLVQALWGGTLAQSRVQAGHDLVLLDRRKVQVRYLANVSDVWVNEHVVRIIPGVEQYALVIFEGFEVIGVVMFTLDRLKELGNLLRKRHPNQDKLLQFTARNWRAIRDDPAFFAAAGVEVWFP